MYSPQDLSESQNSIGRFPWTRYYQYPEGGPSGYNRRRLCYSLFGTAMILVISQLSRVLRDGCYAKEVKEVGSFEPSSG
jgi:hypothetical protein